MGERCAWTSKLPITSLFLTVLNHCAPAHLIIVPFIGRIAAEKDGFGDGVQIVGIGNPTNEVDDGLQDGTTVETTRIRLQQVMVET